MKKLLVNAPLSAIYKMIRKDVKVNGKRGKEETILVTDDEICIYMSDDEFNKLTAKKPSHRAKVQFKVAYEDDNIIVVSKPFGLLTHGDEHEKKNHLVNQVISYLIEKGDYVPSAANTFSPAAVNRLDRNTTGLVLFAKNGETLQLLNKMIREKDKIRKKYLTIVKGRMKSTMYLKDKMEKNEKSNTISVLPLSSEHGKEMETKVIPLKFANGYSLLEIEIVTGRTHQIRGHLAKIGFPIIGDSKYGNFQVNREVQAKFGITTQLLHAYKLEFNDCEGTLHYLNEKKITSDLPPEFSSISDKIFKK